MGKRVTTEKPASWQAVIAQGATDADRRARVWELHLRCMPQTRIAEQTGFHRTTVASIIKDWYREVGADRVEDQKEKLEAAISRMRRIQEQAWTDHDADDERERGVLERAIPGTRYQSQRGQYLKVILDAEKEIARLEGLYEALGDEMGAVVFRVVRDTSGGVAVTTDALVAISGLAENDA